MSGQLPSPSRARPDHLIGQAAGSYLLRRRVGEGGMGVVYLGESADGRRAAVKVLREHVAGDPDARRRLAREFETLRRVRHHRVARVLDADVDGPLPFIATEYVDGAGLQTHVQERGALRGPALARLGFGLGDALAAIHRSGVVHRDLKPGNVLVVDGDPVVIDFGIAHASEDSRLTMTGLVMGTPGYLSPELLEGGTVERATDWWGWAATMVFAATGRSPFGRGPMEVVLDRVRRGEVDLDGVPLVLVPVLRAALSAEPGRRPRPRELRAALHRLAELGDNPPTATFAYPIAAADDRVEDASTQVCSGADVVSAPGGPTVAVGTQTQLVADEPGGPTAVHHEPGPTAVHQEPGPTAVHHEPGPTRGQHGPTIVQHEPDLTRVQAVERTRLQPVQVPSAQQAPPAPYPEPARYAPIQHAPAQYAAGQYAPAQYARTQYARTQSAPPQYAPPQYAPTQHAPAQNAPVPAHLAPGPVQHPGHQQVAPYPGDRRPNELRPTPPPRPRRSGTVLLGWALIALLGAWLPVLTLAGFVVFSALARTVDRIGWALMLRRHEHGGRRASDLVVATLAAPWHAVLACFGAAFALLLPALLGAVAALAADVVSPSGEASPGPIGLAVGFATIGLASWWGPGGRSLRGGTRATIRGLAPGPIGSTLLSLLLLAVIAAAAYGLLSRGLASDWRPVSTPDLASSVPGWAW